MVILQWIVFVLYIMLFNFGWIMGCRYYLKNKGGFMHQTAATTMLMTFTSFIFLLTDANKFNLIWLTPLLIFVSGTVNSIIFSIPIIGNLYLWLTSIFVNIITVGVKTNKTPENYVDAMSKHL